LPPVLEELFAQRTQAETCAAGERVTLKLAQLYSLDAVQEQGQATLTGLPFRQGRAASDRGAAA
jgi:hypothetical protein